MRINLKSPGLPDLPDYDLGEYYFPNGCTLCGGKVEFTDSSRYNIQQRGMIYRCVECGAAVAAHMGSPHNYTPMGSLGTGKVRYLRFRLHELFDKIWMELSASDGVSFGEAREMCYLWLARELKINRNDMHISSLSQKQLRKTIKFCRQGHGDIFCQIRAGSAGGSRGDKESNHPV